MKRFCKECGHANAAEHVRCTNCGEALGPISKRATKPTKSPQTLWKKLLLLAGTVLLLALVGGTVYGMTAYSESAIAGKLTDAVENQDAGAVRELVQLRNGRDLTTAEITAFLALLENQPDVLRDMVRTAPVSEKGKFLYLFDRYAFTFPGVIATDDVGIAGISYTFNGEEFKPKSDEAGVHYGPLLPGLYEVQAFYVNDKEETIEDESYELELVNYEQDGGATLHSGFEFLTPSFTIVNFDEQLISNAKLTLDEREFVFEEGVMRSSAPILSTEVTSAVITFSLPWGEKSIELTTVEENNDIVAPIVDETIQQQLMDQIKRASEEYTAMWTSQSFDHFTWTKASIIQEYRDAFSYNFNNEFYLYASRIDSLRADFENTHSDEGVIYIPVEEVRALGYYEPGYSPEFETDTHYMLFGYTFESEEKTWFLEELFSWDEFDGQGVTIPISNEVVYSTKELEQEAAPVIAANSLDRFNEEENYDFQVYFNYFMIDSIQAINERDYSLVSGYMHPNGPRGAEARDYIAYLDTKGIYEDYISSDIESIERISSDTIQVTSLDAVIIYRPDETETMYFRTVSTFKKYNGEWLCFELLETTEI